MASDRLPGWIAQTMHDYLESRLAAGETRAVAEDNAARSAEENFPGGAPKLGHHIFDIQSDGLVVGYLWLAPSAADPDSWWVFDIEILEQYRRQGHARAALELGHAVAAEHGATSIGLNVFGYNSGAHDLYRSLGYEVTAMQMQRQLP